MTSKSTAISKDIPVSTTNPDKGPGPAMVRDNLPPQVKPPDMRDCQLLPSAFCKTPACMPSHLCLSLVPLHRWNRGLLIVQSFYVVCHTRQHACHIAFRHMQVHFNQKATTNTCRIQRAMQIHLPSSPGFFLSISIFLSWSQPSLPYTSLPFLTPPVLLVQKQVCFLETK